MISVLFGLATALLWGSADVLSRHTGRALGAHGALFGMMAAGAIGVTLWIFASGGAWPGTPSWWTILSAVFAAVNMLLFYEAMRRGPVSVVSPAVGAYPAWAVLFSMLLGTIPSPASLAAMAMTLAGVFLVARFAAAEPDPQEAPGRMVTLTLAMSASILFGLLLLISQRAIAIDGMLPVVWWGRLVGAAVMIPLLLARTAPPAASHRAAWAVAFAQGLLDTAGLVFLFAAGPGVEGALATVSSSAFCVVTVLLARLIYKERIAPGQGIGILAVTAGVVALAALGS